MAPRIPPAARTLVAQVLAARPDTEWEPAGEADGYKRYRKVRFVDAADWLEPVMEAHSDRRIVNYYVEDGDLFVMFVADVRADRTQPFEVDEALKVLEEDEKPAEKKPAKKAARKRATKKATSVSE